MTGKLSAPLMGSGEPRRGLPFAAGYGARPSEGVKASRWRVTRMQSLYRYYVNGATYLYMFDVYWWIQDLETQNGVFGSAPEIDDLTFNPPPRYTIASGSFLFQVPGTQGVYFMCAGAGMWKSFPITTQGALQYYQFKGTPFPNGTPLSDKIMAGWIHNTITQGPPITIPPQEQVLPGE